MLTFYSRTTYLGYMGQLDAAIANVMAQAIAQPKQIAFRWHISSVQLHCFKSLPYIFSQPDLYKRLCYNAKACRKNQVVFRQMVTPTWYHITKWYLKILEAFGEYGVNMLEHEKYGPFKRIKRRWLEHQRHLTKHIPPSLRCDELDFSKCLSSKTPA